MTTSRPGTNKRYFNGLTKRGRRLVESGLKEKRLRGIGHAARPTLLVTKRLRPVRSGRRRVVWASPVTKPLTELDWSVEILPDFTGSR
ncbi:hypothetical protein J6590_007365 [Homalodisca vitripennis]|nr:hypothetical protein J6590_007365 [Homalodisca vitripennis]